MRCSKIVYLVVLYAFSFNFYLNGVKGVGQKSVKNIKKLIQDIKAGHLKEDEIRIDGKEIFKINSLKELLNKYCIPKEGYLKKRATMFPWQLRLLGKIPNRLKKNFKKKYSSSNHGEDSDICINALKKIVLQQLSANQTSKEKFFTDLKNAELSLKGKNILYELPLSQNQMTKIYDLTPSYLYKLCSSKKQIKDKKNQRKCNKDASYNLQRLLRKNSSRRLLNVYKAKVIRDKNPEELIKRLNQDIETYTKIREILLSYVDPNEDILRKIEEENSIQYTYLCMQEEVDRPTIITLKKEVILDDTSKEKPQDKGNIKKRVMKKKKHSDSNFSHSDDEDSYNQDISNESNMSQAELGDEDSYNQDISNESNMSQAELGDEISYNQDISNKSNMSQAESGDEIGYNQDISDDEIDGSLESAFLSSSHESENAKRRERAKRYKQSHHIEDEGDSEREVYFLSSDN